MLMRALMGAGGYWERACQVCIDHELLIKKLESSSLEPDTKLYELLRLATSTFFFPYFRDTPKENRIVHNLVGKIFSEAMRASHRNHTEAYDFQPRLSTPKKKLRIGYICHCFRHHSVGYLARWLIKAHNREEFEVYGYVIYQRDYDGLQQWYKQQFDQVCSIGVDCPEEGKDIAQRIYDDEIDILIDLDSITLDLTCEVMAYRPAPIQVTWLGWDASGIPEIDYYIADPYVLPENAQEYYSEKIWRLPQTYLAITGFEVDVPDISRAKLDIPDNAIVYMTAQKGYKRHPDTIRLQMKIISEVPNSYLLIKGPSEETAIQQYFTQLASECNVSEDRLRFLPQTLSAETHRANLRIADIILDTFPYNGATTTMEALWMEVPLVTLVGQQFSARNSYTMMINAGIEEGIAWTPEEYVEWGIRLGTEEQLRQKVLWKLRESKNKAPLWDTAAFTYEMETAYRGMWDRYIKGMGDTTKSL
jgi:predicted O-linked N-acetylglucosamine transferase (SPINDLY family)